MNANCLDKRKIMRTFATSLSLTSYIRRTMKKMFMMMAVAASVSAVASCACCSNSEKAAEECCCTECAEVEPSDSLCAPCDSTSVVEE